MSVLLNTLYVTTEGAWVHKDHETVVVDVDDVRKLTVPLHHLGAIICFGRITVSPWLMHACMDADIAIAFCSPEGRFLGRVEGAPKGNVLLRRLQYRQADSPGARTAIVRSIVAGKLHNTVVLMRRLARETDSDSARNALSERASHVANALAQTEFADTVDVLRGCEGQGGAAYWSVFDQAVRRDEPEFRFAGRSRRPPLDRVNALLSFLYALLHNDCASALNAVGLDPAVGFLHTDRPGRLSLALDLMEEFRPTIADRLALALINRRQLNPGDFVVEATGAVRLGDEGRKTVLVAYQKRKQDEVTHPFTGQQLPLGLIPHLQARLLARTIRGDMDAYPPFALR